MDPSIEATLCDFLHNVKIEEFDTLEELYNELFRLYHVSDWGITFDMFGEFMRSVISGKRCRACGERKFPYFLEGDKECVRCLI